MASPLAERAVVDCITHDKALLKFISANDAGATGSHQCGFYLPAGVHEMYTVHPPVKGTNEKHPIEITWEDGRTTNSMVTWYGKAKSEYRLTCFGRDFPFLTPDLVGALFVLIPKSVDSFLAYVFDTHDDIEHVQTALGTEVIDAWGVYDGSNFSEESDEECLRRMFGEFASQVTEFPSGQVFSDYTWVALNECVNQFADKTPDQQLIRLVQEEYRMFQLAERKICEPQIHRMFATVDEFLKNASSIMNRRKSRAGRSLENHVQRVFERAGVPHEMRPRQIDGKPDLIVPSEQAYFDDSYPDELVYVVGIKTTCKDRWRQVVNEGKRIKTKYLITMQQGISTNQLNEMAEANVKLVVPKKLHKLYPRDTNMRLMTVEELISEIATAHS